MVQNALLALSQWEERGTHDHQIAPHVLLASFDRGEETSLLGAADRYWPVTVDDLERTEDAHPHWPGSYARCAYSCDLFMPCPINTLRWRIAGMRKSGPPFGNAPLRAITPAMRSGMANARRYA